MPLLQLVPGGAVGLVHRLEKKSQVLVVQSLLSSQSLWASQKRWTHTAPMQSERTGPKLTTDDEQSPVRAACVQTPVSGFQAFYRIELCSWTKTQSCNLWEYEPHPVGSFAADF